MRFSTLLCIVVWSVAAVARAGEPTQAASAARKTYGEIPWHFEPNVGQWDPAVRFLARGRDFTAFVTATELVLRIDRPVAPDGVTKAAAGHGQQRSAVLRLELIGAGADGRLEGREELAARVNYYSGRDPERWRGDVPVYGRVLHENAYTGIDVVYRGTKGQVEFDFVVAPGADPASIRLGVGGAESIVQEGCDLVFRTAAGDVRLPQPDVYQQTPKGRRAIAAHYRATQRQGDNAPAEPPRFEIGFDIGSYDRALPLVIDPLVLIYSTFLGGSLPSFDSTDTLMGIAVSASAYAYVTGFTTSTDFPLSNQPLQPTYAGGAHDAFVTKLAPDGSFVFSTYLGGTADDVAEAIAISNIGVVFVGGSTASADFPTLQAYQPDLNGARDAFVVRLGPSGSLLSGTYLGGAGAEQVHAMAVRSSTSAPIPAATGQPTLLAITGETSSGDFPTLNPYQTDRAGSSDAFVAVLNPQVAPAVQLLYSTYLGGSGSEDRGLGIAIDAMGLIYVAGDTTTDDFPTANPYQANRAGAFDAFVAKIDPTAVPSAQLVYATYLGGSGFDRIGGIALDSLNAAYVTGGTSSTDFPTVFPLQAANAGDLDAFVAVLAPSGTSLQFATYLGGTSGERGAGVAVDAGGNIYVTGPTGSTDFPLLSPMVMPDTAGSGDVFLTKIGAGQLVYSTKIGGTGNDNPRGIARDGYGDVYVAGSTESATFPIKQAVQPVKGLGFDGFVTRIREQGSNVVVTVGNVINAATLASTYTVSNSGLAAAENTQLVVRTRGVGFLLLDVSPSQGRCRINANQRAFTCDLGTVYPGDHIEIAVVVQPLTPRRSSTLVFSARARHDGKELAPADNKVVQTIELR